MIKTANPKAMTRPTSGVMREVARMSLALKLDSDLKFNIIYRI
jgi:hypothetical protein